MLSKCVYVYRIYILQCSVNNEHGSECGGIAHMCLRAFRSDLEKILGFSDLRASVSILVEHLWPALDCVHNGGCTWTFNVALIKIVCTGLCTRWWLQWQRHPAARFLRQLESRPAICSPTGTTSSSIQGKMWDKMIPLLCLSSIVLEIWDTTTWFSCISALCPCSVLTAILMIFHCIVSQDYSISFLQIFVCSVGFSGRILHRGTEMQSWRLWSKRESGVKLWGAKGGWV